MLVFWYHFGAQVPGKNLYSNLCPPTVGGHGYEVRFCVQKVGRILVPPSWRGEQDVGDWWLVVVVVAGCGGGGWWLVVVTTTSHDHHQSDLYCFVNEM